MPFFTSTQVYRLIIIMNGVATIAPPVFGKAGWSGRFVRQNRASRSSALYGKPSAGELCRRSKLSAFDVQNNVHHDAECRLIRFNSFVYV